MAQCATENETTLAYVPIADNHFLQYLLGYHYTQYLLYQFVVHLAFSFPTAMMPLFVFQHITFQFTLLGEKDGILEASREERERGRIVTVWNLP